MFYRLRCLGAYCVSGPLVQAGIRNESSRGFNFVLALHLKVYFAVGIKTHDLKTLRLLFAPLPLPQVFTAQVAVIRVWQTAQAQSDFIPQGDAPGLGQILRDHDAAVALGVIKLVQPPAFHQIEVAPAFLHLGHGAHVPGGHDVKCVQVMVQEFKVFLHKGVLGVL